MQVDIRMPEDQDSWSTPSVIPTSNCQVERYRDFANTCCMRSVSVFVSIMSLSHIATQVIMYTLYFHFWHGTLVDFELRHPGKIDVGFLSNVIWILVPVEAWLLTTAVGALMWVVEMISKKMGLSQRDRIVVALVTASILFGAFNFGAYNFHQFAMNKILTYQTDHNTTRHLFQEVDAKF